MIHSARVNSVRVSRLAIHGAPLLATFPFAPVNPFALLFSFILFPMGLLQCGAARFCRSRKSMLPPEDAEPRSSIDISVGFSRSVDLSVPIKCPFKSTSFSPEGKPQVCAISKSAQFFPSSMRAFSCHALARRHIVPNRVVLQHNRLVRIHPLLLLYSRTRVSLREAAFHGHPF